MVVEELIIYDHAPYQSFFATVAGHVTLKTDTSAPSYAQIDTDSGCKNMFVKHGTL